MKQVSETLSVEKKEKRRWKGKENARVYSGLLRDIAMVIDIPA